MRYHEFRAMSTDILLAAEGPADEMDPVFLQVEAFVAASERRFTRFSADSELSALNRSAGTWFDASAEMYEVLSLAFRFHQKTLGLFDPSILDALERAGYDRTIDEVRSLNGSIPHSGLASSTIKPGPSIQAGRGAGVQARGKPGNFSDIRLDPALRRIWLPPEMRIDLGGIAKGWIAEQAARRMQKYVSACGVNAGGDMFLIGLPQGAEWWEVGLEDPRVPSQDLLTLQVEAGAVATSSIMKRVWQQGQQTRHHLIDPRTGEPAETTWLSVTVISASTALAEVFAKALLIAGPDGARRLAEDNPGLSYLAVDTHGQVWIPENGDIVQLQIEK